MQRFDELLSNVKGSNLDYIQIHCTLYLAMSFKGHNSIFSALKSTGEVYTSWNMCVKIHEISNSVYVTHCWWVRDSKSTLKRWAHPHPHTKYMSNTVTILSLRFYYKITSNPFVPFSLTRILCIRRPSNYKITLGAVITVKRQSLTLTTSEPVNEFPTSGENFSISGILSTFYDIKSIKVLQIK